MICELSEKQSEQELGKLHALAIEQRRAFHHTTLNSQHWLLAAIEQYEELVDDLAPGLDASDFATNVRAQLEGGITAQPLALEQVRQETQSISHSNSITSPGRTEVVAAILRLSDACKYVAGPYALIQLPDESLSEVMETGDDSKYYPRHLNPTPTLDDLGLDLTDKAIDYLFTELICRDAELELVIETLCRPTKCNPVLVGPAGVGKTAIVEELARRIVERQVPRILDGVRVIALQPSVIVAGASSVGEVESRVKTIIQEASQDGIILFIDESHSMVNSSGVAGTGDIASLITPALARGSLTLIGATTDDEYRQYIERDGALERRLQPIRTQQSPGVGCLDLTRHLP